MKNIFVVLCLFPIIYFSNIHARPQNVERQRCVNMWDEGCINGQFVGAGSDNYFVGGGGGINPGKRCVNMWDEGCINGQLGGAGSDNYFLGGGGSNPGKRCVNMWDDGCVNGQLGGAGGDDFYLGGGGFNPGKRSLQDLMKKLSKNGY